MVTLIAIITIITVQGTKHIFYIHLWWEWWSNSFQAICNDEPCKWWVVVASVCCFLWCSQVYDENCVTVWLLILQLLLCAMHVYLFMFTLLTHNCSGVVQQKGEWLTKSPGIEGESNSFHGIHWTWNHCVSICSIPIVNCVPLFLFSLLHVCGVSFTEHIYWLVQVSERTE